MSQPQHPDPDHHDLLRGILDSSLDGIMAFTALRDPAGGIIDFVFNLINATAEQIVGRSARDLLGKRLLDELPGNKADGLFDAYVNVVETGEPFVTEHHYAHDGLNHWFRICATRCRDGFAVTFADITASKSTESKLRETAHLLSEAQRVANIGSWSWDCVTNRIAWSDQTKRMFGMPVTAEAPDFEAHQKQIHPDDLEAWQSVVEESLATHRPFCMTYRAVLPDRTTRIIEARGNCEVDDAGSVVRMFGTAQDITDKHASERELRKLSMVASRTEDGVVLADEQGRVEWINPAFTAITGYTIEELRGKVPGKVLQGPDTDPQTVARIRERLSRGEGFREQLLNYRKNGEAYWIEIEVQPLRNAKGEVTQFMAIERDITARIQQQQALDENQRRLEFALDSTRTGLWDWDVASGKTYFSPSWYTMLGYEPGELPMDVASWMRIAEPGDLERAKSALEDYFQGKTRRYACEMRVKNKAGDWQWILDVGEAIERDADGAVTRMIGLHLDIGQQKADQAELESARDQARQASAAKSSFVANMSHEIRTPMNAILGYADLMLDADQTEADKRNHAQTIRRNGKHLLDILNDVLDISKIEAGKMSIESVPCAPDQLFADVITLMMPKAMQQGIDLDFEAADPLPQRAVTDPTRVRQVLINLVGNAIKFTRAGSVRVVVRNQSASADHAVLTCEVIDTGVGIAPEAQRRLFKPFSQADDSTTREFGGSGLGLAISHNLCNLLGGELTCTSTPGVGSTFTATFSVGIGEATDTRKPNSRPANALHQPQPLAGRRVLIVEDGPDNRRLIDHYLTKAGADSAVAENGALGRDAALEALQAGEPFDAVLMDMQMPVLDGYDATRALRDAGYDRPIIALTAHASSDDRVRCLDAGCDAYLSKPVDRHQLARTVADQIALAASDGAYI